MANQNNSWVNQHFVSADHSGLQPAQAGLEFVQPGLEPASEDSWNQSYTPGGYTDASQAESQSEPLTSKSQSQKILGLSVKTFWIVVVALVVILAAGIGGGVGGGLAAQSRAESSTDSSSASSDGAVSPSISSEGPTETSSDLSSPTATATSTTSETPTTLTTITTSTSTTSSELTSETSTETSSQTSSAASAETSSSVAASRVFTLFDDVNYGGANHTEERLSDSTCWNLNGKGDQASSVKGGAGCTTFFRNANCEGATWKQRGDAETVPSFLDNHISSFRNQC